MSDFLVELGKNPTARRAIKSLGLPIPMPQALSRAKGPCIEQPLANQRIVIGGAGGPLAAVAAETLAAAGADPIVVGDAASAASFRDPGEAHGRPVEVIDATAEMGDQARVHALMFDASTLATPDDLRALYDFFHPWVRKLGRCGRVVVLGRPGADTPAATATQAALDGFVRSVAKEIGRGGSTANLITVAPGAEDRLAGVLRFALSRRSAFVSAQPFQVGAAAPASADQRWVRPLEGKVALITGAARGIGAATARRFAQEGATVVCLDRPADDGPTSKLAREIDGAVLLTDVTDEDAPARIRDELGARFGGVDIVVHNAGVTRDKTIGRMKPAHWEQAIDINLGAVCRITDALVDASTLRDGGRIVCLSSVAGIAGNVGQTNYAASKAGIIGFVGAWAERLASRGITVNAIAPGFIETRLTAAIPTVIREAARRLAALGQGGKPVDVAEVITFLSTPGAAGLTGQVVRVCGGALIGR